MKYMLEEATEVANGVWLTFAPPHQLTRLGQPKSSNGRRSVLLASQPQFDQKKGLLTFDAESVVVLNVGTTPSTVVVDTIVAADLAEHEGESEGTHDLGPGDREFYLLAEHELQGLAQEAAVDLIREVRRKWPGDLKRGERNNFSNTPDNFWYVIVQPRVQALSVTIRGTPDKFKSTIFDLKADRPGYTRFAVSDPNEIPEAIRLIGQSKRKET